MTLRRILFVRHGHTAYNSGSNHDERFRSWSEISLSDQGVVEAAEASMKLQYELHAKPKLIYSSDLPRARETAELVRSGFPGTPIHALRALRDWNLGEYINRSVATFGADISYFQERPEVPIPGGESYREYYERVKKAFLTIIGRQLFSVRDGDFVVVTHSRNLLTLENILTKGAASIPVRGKPNPGEILELNLWMPENLRGPSWAALAVLGGRPFFWEKRIW